MDDDGNLADCHFQVPELRGLEVLCVRRPVEEAPWITTRICGVCPETHHMASVKAAEAVQRRDAASDGSQAGSCSTAGSTRGHTTYFYALGGPDFVIGPMPRWPSILGVVREVGLELAAEVIEQWARGQRVVPIIRGRVLHPVTALPGGMSKRVTKEE